MAKATEKPETTQLPVDPMNYQALIDSNGEALATVVRCSEAMLSSMTNLGSEVMSFANTRLQQNLQTTENLSHCKDFESAFRVQCDYAQTASQQYLTEATKIMELAAGVARASMTPFEERSRQTQSRPNGDK